MEAVVGEPPPQVLVTSSSILWFASAGLTSDRSGTRLKATVRIFQAFSIKAGPGKGLDAVFVEQLVQIVALKRQFCRPSITAVRHAVHADRAVTLHVVLF